MTEETLYRIVRINPDSSKQILFTLEDEVQAEFLFDEATHNNFPGTTVLLEKLLCKVVVVNEYNV